MADVLFSSTQFAVGIGGGLVVGMASAALYGRAVKARRRREFDRVLHGRSARRFAPGAAEAPSFGTLPEKFEEAAEFEHRGQRLFAYRHTVSTRRMQGDDPVRDSQPYRVVRLATAETPRLSIVPKEHWVPSDEQPLITGVAEFDQRYLVFADDEEFARSALPMETMSWLLDKKLRTPLVLGDGVLSSESPGELDADVLRYADILVDLARRMPPLRQPSESASGASAVLRPGVGERVLLVLLVLGFLPLVATLLIIGVVSFVNSLAYFFGADGRVLSGGETQLLPVLTSDWYGPFPNFGSGVQSFLLGMALFGLPLIAAVIGAIRRARAASAPKP